MRQRLLFILFLPIFLNFIWVIYPAKGDGLIQIMDTQVSYSFGEFIKFKAKIESSQPVESVEVFYRPVDGPSTFVGFAELTGNNIAFIHEIGQVSGSIPVFSTIEYRYRVTFRDGETVLSDVYSFDYVDNRFDWKTLDDESFRVFWVEGDLAFGQEILDAARS